MADLSLDLRRRLVEAYKSGRTKSYEATAEMFAVGRASVSRLLRRHRETGDVKPKPRGGNNPRRVDLEWLRDHAIAHPDARLVDRVQAWLEASGRRVTHVTISNSLRAIGWTHKKRLRSPASATKRRSSRSAPRSPSLSRSSTRDG